MAVQSPAIPDLLVRHAEPPIGDYLNHRLVRAMTATLDRLEPDWGRFQGDLYTIDDADLPHLPAALAEAMPPGWKPLDLAGFAPPDGEVHAFASGDRLFAALVVDPGEADVIPVMVLRNEALVASSDKPAQ